MKKGDLVKVSNKGFTAIGFIKNIMKSQMGEFFIVHYLTTNGVPNFRGYTNDGLWSKKYLQLLKEVKDEKDVSKT